MMSGLGPASHVQVPKFNESGKAESLRVTEFKLSVAVALSHHDDHISELV